LTRHIADDKGCKLQGSLQNKTLTSRCIALHCGAPGGIFTHLKLFMEKAHGAHSSGH
jgi:hypothetical protein